jgi:hypothetical protein
MGVSVVARFSKYVHLVLHKKNGVLGPLMKISCAILAHFGTCVFDYFADKTPFHFGHSVCLSNWINLSLSDALVGTV